MTCVRCPQFIPPPMYGFTIRYENRDNSVTVKHDRHTMNGIGRVPLFHMSMTDDLRSPHTLHGTQAQ